MRPSTKLIRLDESSDDPYDGPTRVGPMSEVIAQKMLEGVVEPAAPNADPVKRSGVRRPTVGKSSSGESIPQSGVRRPNPTLPRFYDEDEPSDEPTVLNAHARPGSTSLLSEPKAFEVSSAASNIVDAVIGEMAGAYDDGTWETPTAPVPRSSPEAERETSGSTAVMVRPALSSRVLSARGPTMPVANMAIIAPLVAPPQHGLMTENWGARVSAAQRTQLQRTLTDLVLVKQILLGTVAFVVAVAILVRLLF
jgi:hypothetical protein